ncbi:DUF6880 family protein [Caulobacter sp.]|uniref:DUF6880 family protein n=1 Tax=Caulobacter sp. TaxID=78 RepID=UPI001B13C51C|nr:DUF6880 family protein [Caulobacter sp.]MBO9545826.1 hypothetical protein [Caulobacter sp.]
MAKPSLASQKKVTPENLAGLGAERLAQILFEVAQSRTDLKRRLRMELAADLGPGHLVAEIDKRLSALETSRGQVGWRQKPAFLRDLEALRSLIAERLGAADSDAALERLWRFLGAHGQTARRLKDRDEAFEAVYQAAARDLGALLAQHDPHLAANALVEAAAGAPQAWAAWAPAALPPLTAAASRVALALAQARPRAAPGWTIFIRHLADAAADTSAYAQTFSDSALATPPVAVEVARRWLATGRTDEAGAALRLAAPKPKGLLGRLAAPDFDWESAWIDYLDAAGERDAAQAVRWASFQRTLEASRAKAYVARLGDFDDVEAEGRIFAMAAAQDDFQKGLSVLMAWPALPEASAMILARGQDARLDPELAETWAGKLRRRFPAAAERLLRRGAAAAFRRGALRLADRLTQEAEALADAARVAG